MKIHSKPFVVFSSIALLATAFLAQSAHTSGTSKTARSPASYLPKAYEKAGATSLAPNRMTAIPKSVFADLALRDSLLDPHAIAMSQTRAAAHGSLIGSTKAEVQDASGGYLFTDGNVPAAQKRVFLSDIAGSISSMFK